MPKHRINPMIVSIFILFSLLSGAAQGKPMLTLMTHDSFAVSQKTIAFFEQRFQVKINILKSGDAGAALTQAILSKNNPLGDVFFGIDNTFMSRALKADLFIPYAPPELTDVPAVLQLDASHRLTPVDFGDVCLNFDLKWFKDRQRSMPESLADLITPAYKGLTVVQNPATSSPGLAFLMTTIAVFGESGYLNYWRHLRQNEVLVTNGWSDAYYGKFSRAKGGTCPIVVSYATSPAAEVHYSSPPIDTPPTAALTQPDTVFRQIEFAGILKGTHHLKLSQSLLRFMLSPEFQKDIPLHMWVYPAVAKTPLPAVFQKFAKKGAKPVAMDHDRMDQRRKQWIESWTQAVLH